MRLFKSHMTFFLKKVAVFFSVQKSPLTNKLLTDIQDVLDEDVCCVF